MLMFLIAGAVGGATSAFYLAYNYHPLLLNGAIHGGIFVSPLVAMYFVKKLNVRTTGLYLAGALPARRCGTRARASAFVMCWFAIRNGASPSSCSRIVTIRSRIDWRSPLRS